ncbi:MAG TPA: efflux RND transporter periplasmic adaptor subunit [Candidatus Saccharimonadales bacterium]|jgi:RND family efflux transporter MFP subunit|nr:efflux RND transporter periplasmic adaptor subunit [Candidatus Saccharimonadales bacterium]
MAMSIDPSSRSYDLSSLRIDPQARKPAGRGGRLAMIAGTVLALVVVVLVLLAFRGQKKVVEVAAARPAGDARATALLNASGYVTPRRRATVAAKVTGRVEQIYAEEGLRVRAGQVLALLDCSQPNATLTSARTDRDAIAAAGADLEVQLANADRELSRAQALREAGVNSQQALDAARTTADSLRSKIALTKEQVRAAGAKIGVAGQDVENCTVRAPFDGVVVTKDAQRGEIVSPVSAGGGFTRTGIATVVDMNSIEVEVDVNESYIARVKPQQKVLATLDAYPEWQIPAKVRTVIPTADRQKATVKVRVSFDQLDPRILPDMGVKVAFLSDQPVAGEQKTNPARAVIPGSTVRDDAGQKIVFVVHDGKVERRAVNLGAQHGDDVEVLAGVSPGESLVVRGGADLREGQAVEIKQ